MADESDETFPMAYGGGFMPQRGMSCHRAFSQRGRGGQRQVASDRGHGWKPEQCDQVDEVQLALMQEQGDVVLDDAEFARLVQQQEQVLQFFRDQAVAKKMQEKDNHQLLDDDSAYAQQFRDLDHEAQKKKKQNDLQLARQLQEKEEQDQIEADVAMAQQTLHTEQKKNSNWDEVEEDGAVEDPTYSTGSGQTPPGLTNQQFGCRVHLGGPQRARPQRGGPQMGRPGPPPGHYEDERTAADAAFAQSIHNRDVAYKRQKNSNWVQVEEDGAVKDPTYSTGSGQTPPGLTNQQFGCRVGIDRPRRGRPRQPAVHYEDERTAADAAFAQSIHNRDVAYKRQKNSSWVEVEEDGAVAEPTYSTGSGQTPPGLTNQQFGCGVHPDRPQRGRPQRGGPQRGRPRPPPIHYEDERIATDVAFAQSIHNRDVAYKRQLESDFQMALNIAEKDKNRDKSDGTTGHSVTHNRPSARGHMIPHPNPNVNRLYQWTLTSMRTDQDSSVRPPPGLNSMNDRIGNGASPGFCARNVVADGAVGGTMNPYVNTPVGAYVASDQVYHQDLLLPYLLSGNNIDWLVAPDFDENDYEALWDLAEQIGEVKGKGMTPEQINAIPTTTFHASQNASGGDADDCKICFTDFEPSEKLRRLSCLHMFHVQCIDEWLKENATCPICREEQKK